MKTSMQWAVVMARGLAVAALALAPGRAFADEIWVSPTYQQDLGGLGIGSNVAWPASAAGAVRFAWAIPNDLQAPQSAKIVLIPHAGGASMLNVIVCAAQHGNSATFPASCTPSPFMQAFTGVVNQLTEVDVTAAVSPHVGLAGATYLAVIAYSSPNTATDHIVGLRFAYTSTAPSLNGANVFTANQVVNVANGTAAVTGNNAGNSVTSYGVQGVSDSGVGAGVFGKSTAGSGASYGVYGDATANLGQGTGVFGIGTSYGLWGQSTRTASTGVFGQSMGTLSLTYGVYGDALANTQGAGIGVFGTGNGFGVYGQNNYAGASSAGVWGESRMSTGAVYGVGGLVNSTTAGAAAVFGTANGSSGATFGVRGISASSSTDAAGVRGDANGGSGFTAGGYFRSASTNGTGVLGWAPAGTGATYGVRGESDSVSGIGVLGYTPAASSPSDRTVGVQGQSDTASNGVGVAGFATNNAGFRIWPPLGTSIGLLGSVTNGGYGVYSIGDAYVSGNTVIGGNVYGGEAHVDSVLLGGSYFISALPPCASDNNRGKMILTEPGGGSDQRLYVCIERSNGTYFWKQVF